MGRLSNPQEFEHESIQDTRSIVEYLEALVEGFRQGRLLLRTDERALSFSPQGLLHLEIKAKRGGSRNKIAFKISWKDGAELRDGTLEIGK